MIPASASINIVGSAIKVFGLLAASFIAAVLCTPLLTRFLYRHKLWRKEVRTSAPDGTATPLFAALHRDREVRVPRSSGRAEIISEVARSAPKRRHSARNGRSVTPAMGATNKPLRNWCAPSCIGLPNRAAVRRGAEF